MIGSISDWTCCIPEAIIWIRKSSSLIDFERITLFRKRLRIRNFSFPNGIHCNNRSMLKFVWRLLAMDCSLLAFCPMPITSECLSCVGAVNCILKFESICLHYLPGGQLGISSVYWCPATRKYLCSLSKTSTRGLRARVTTRNFWVGKGCCPHLFFKWFKNI